MPEGPEVHLTAIGASKALSGMIFDGMRIQPEALGSSILDVADFNSLNYSNQLGVMKSRVNRIYSYGKIIIWVVEDTNGDEVSRIYNTLSMAGHYEVVRVEDRCSVPSHVRFSQFFTNLETNEHKALHYYDGRLFSRWEVDFKESLRKVKHHPEKYGPCWKSLSSVQAYERFKSFYSKKNKKVAIKPLLLDPHCYYGPGNAYTTEALHESEIDPSTPWGNLKETQLLNLHVNLWTLMHKGVTWGGLSVKDWVNTEGISGRTQEQLKVFGRKLCRTCGGKVTRIVLASRGTYFCGECQK